MSEMTAPITPISYANNSSAGRRMAFLDILRGLGALSVFCEHSLEKLSLGFTSFATHYFQMGQFGVMVFFLCSGFIIPVSLAKSRSLKKFWIGRFFRLYPLYWFSLLAALLLNSFSIYQLPHSFLVHPWASIAANFTMLQMFLGYPNAIPLYWSLAFEMIFYVIISGLFIIKYKISTLNLAYFFLSLSLLSILFVREILHGPAPIGLIFNIATMFVGTVFYEFHQGKLGKSQMINLFVFSLAIISLNLFVAFYHNDDPHNLGTRSFLPMLSAWLGAYIVFFAATVFKFKSLPKVALYLGEISYSLYLMHPLVMSLLPLALHPVLTFLIWLAVLIALASLTYRFVERPFIAMGRQVNQKLGVVSVASPVS